MPVALLTMSHSPLLEHADPPAEVAQAVQDAFAKAREFVTDFDPDLIINFGPDHYNGFFYDLMPPFCVGFAAVGTGDYNSFDGELNVPTETAQDLAQYIIDQDLDTAISRRMEVDHGAVQPIEIMFGEAVATLPVIPVFVNGLAKPFMRMQRVRKLGDAVGSFVKEALADQKVLLIGSGGLSHEPPVPQWATATEEQRKFLLEGRHPTPEARAAREANTIAVAKAFAEGKADIRDLNPEWDAAFMDICRSGELERFDEFTAEKMAEDAGRSSHETRTWVAAFSALRAAAGTYDVTYEFYRPIREYIAGFGVMTAKED
ncbi:3-(2,3-dihydroxyphenyl)propionate dioxygenase [Bowdeniella nasicola]|uniref:2,3-dihydroxyphenylpropionate/2,3-dihydroxicinnamic acid 1,2-dioxygenase n=1 Tax=Bowdeniella nasicola TaxID=208480 RepID=A0A1Q5Q2X0_9ACTO|nr:3-carboxyethylcatechol 2,3-dioxygenase [Bowdeniella nasicola]OKL54039.1 3-(2,3-dihydroxyphenyl)propionate dioxygenase [Bowdeniella nasicola]